MTTTPPLSAHCLHSRTPGPPPIQQPNHRCPMHPSPDLAIKARELPGDGLNIVSRVESLAQCLAAGLQGLFRLGTADRLARR